MKKKAKKMMKKRKKKSFTVTPGFSNDGTVVVMVTPSLKLKLKKKNLT